VAELPDLEALRVADLDLDGLDGLGLDCPNGLDGAPRRPSGAPRHPGLDGLKALSAASSCVNSPSCASARRPSRMSTHRRHTAERGTGCAKYGPTRRIASSPSASAGLPRSSGYTHRP
jgi:hypothetical protein